MALLSRWRSRAVAEGLDVACPACDSRGRALALVVEPGCRLVGCPGCGTQYLRRIEPGPDARGRPPPDGDDATRTGTESEYWEEYKFEVYDSEDVRRSQPLRMIKLCVKSCLRCVREPDWIPAQLRRLRDVGAVTADTDVVAVHLSHHNPPAPELSRRLAEHGARVVEDGASLRTGGRSAAVARGA